MMCEICLLLIKLFITFNYNNIYISISHMQGWARNVKARDRDAHLPRQRQDRDKTLKFRDKTFVGIEDIEVQVF